MEELFEAGVGDEDPFDDHRNILYPSSIEGLTDEQKLEGSYKLREWDVMGQFHLLYIRSGDYTGCDRSLLYHNSFIF